ncbi:Cupredoxin [Mycena amicta]|nr:Cupredoxin [Mycena amicta]
MLSSTGLVLLLSTFVAAQDYGYGGGGSTPTTTAPGASAAPVAPSDTPGNHNINVAAGGQFVFSPANITAAQGDKVTFWFPNNGLTHSVTQSSFAAPCTYLVATSNTSAGFDSGLTAGTQFTITIEDATKPIWFHCAQITHCGLGMVGSINAQTTNNTFDAFVSAAKAIGNNEKAESGSFVSGGVNAQAVGSPANTGSGAAPSTTTKSNSATRAGASIGMVLGGVLLAML